MIPIIDKSYTPTHTFKTCVINSNSQKIKSTTQMIPTTSPTTNISHIEIKDYCSSLESTISVPMVDLSKHSAFLLQKQLHDEIQLASEDNMNISNDETVFIEKLPTKINIVRMIMMFKTPGERRELMMIMPPLMQLRK